MIVMVTEPRCMLDGAIDYHIVVEEFKHESHSYDC